VWANNFHETKHADGSIKVAAFGRTLTCGVCGNTSFRERTTLLNTQGLAFFELNWLNKSATNFICSRCGYIFWFLPQ
jgi:ribosomal protein S27AE